MTVPGVDRVLTTVHFTDIVASIEYVASQPAVSELLASCGLALVEQRTVGDEGGGKRAWGGFAVAVVE